MIEFQNGTFWIIVKSSKKEYTRIFPFRELRILQNVTRMRLFVHFELSNDCTRFLNEMARNMFRHILWLYNIRKIQQNKMPKNAEKYVCEKCDFTCCKLSNYNTHIKSKKHNTTNTTNTTNIQQLKIQVYECICGKQYSHRASLWNHTQKCKFPTTPEIKQDKVEEPVPDNKDVMIEKLMEELTAERAEKSDMKSMFMMMMEKFQEMQTKTNENTREMLKETVKGNQELVNKVIDVIPKMGNTTNNNNNTTNNNTLNFYLTNTCKDAESIHDFTDRYVKQCTDFFTENYRSIANNQMCLATNVYNIMFTCLNENPQYLNFIQTTDVKNGIHYVKEKKKDKDRQLYGEAEFIKYVDGFERAGASIGHAINKAFVPLQSEFSRKLESEVGRPPNEDDYEDEEEYEDLLDKYKQRKSESGRHLNMHIFNAMRLFDNSSRKMEILTKTRRIKNLNDV